MSNISPRTGLPIVEGATHCNRCGSLVWEHHTVDGIGITCGCLKKEYERLKKLERKNQPPQPELWGKE